MGCAIYRSAWAIVCYNWQAVQSLGVVTTIVPTLSFFINRFHPGIVEDALHIMSFNKEKFVCIRNGVYIEKGLDVNTPICRYTNYLNLLLLLNESFNISLRKCFEDKLEKYSIFNSFVADLHPVGYHATTEERNLSSSLHSELQNACDNMYVSCWTYDIRENYLMWKSYTNHESGVRIKSTIKNIVDSIKDDNIDIYIGKINYSNCKINKDIQETLFYKQDYYKNEQEIRFYFKRRYINTNSNEVSSCLFLKIDPYKFVREIILSPYTKYTDAKKIADILISKHGYLKDKIKHSKIRI